MFYFSFSTNSNLFPNCRLDTKEREQEIKINNILEIQRNHGGEYPLEIQKKELVSIKKEIENRLFVTSSFVDQKMAGKKKKAKQERFNNRSCLFLISFLFL